MKLKFLLSVLLVAGYLVGCASVAPQGEIEAPVAVAEENGGANLAKNEEEKICKVRPITGSRFKQKTCMTEKEWENMAHETKKMLDEDTRSKPSNF